MTRRFTVIQGGLSFSSARTGDGPSADGSTPAEEGGEWRVDLNQAATFDDGAVGAWRALMTRRAVADPFHDPDYLLTAARHRAQGRRIAFALAWNRDARGLETLHAVLPMSMPHPIWGRGRASLWWAPGLVADPLIDETRATEVADVVRRHLLSLRRPVTLDEKAERPETSEMPAPVVLASRPAAGVRRIPADSLVGVRPAEDRSPAEVERIREPARVRDAVETFLALDARTSRRPIVADPSEAAMVRVVSRLFARRHQMSVDLARRAGEVVAGTLHLGSGLRSVAWRHAAQG